VFRYRLNGKREKVVIGRYPDVTLKAARDERAKMAAQVARGESPAAERRLVRASLTTNPTVKEFGERYYTEQVIKRWKDPKTIRRYLDNEIFPTLGGKTLKDVNAFGCAGPRLAQAGQWAHSGSHATPQRHQADIRLRD